MFLDKMQSPETRVNSQDKSKELRLTLSPRLKSFPAGKIKKWNTSMFVPESISALVTQQNPYESRTFYSNCLVRNNNGYDDTTMTQMQQSKSASTTNQQNITGKQIYQTTPHSDSSISQQITFLEGHPHRAFVPNIFHHGVIIPDQLLQNSQTIFNQPKVVQTTNPQQSSCNLHTVIDQNCPEVSTLNNKCEKQPTGDRNVPNHKHIMQIQQQKQAAIIKDPDASCDNERSTNHNQNICCISPHNLFEQIYQQSHQMSNKMELMPNQQQQIHNNNNLEKYYYYNQQLIDSPTQGMTSPQDMTITQIKLMQHNPSFNQSVWPQKNRWIETTTQSQQHLHHSLSQHHHMPTINFNQRNFKFQNQSNSSKNYMKHKSTKLVAKDNQRDDRNQVLYFTPDMIRDQELLVSTLRQQDISDEVMRRQFDALLNEQRRHLAYVAQFQQEADTLDTKQPRYMRKRTGEYEKPEWMVHITPPRISCNKVEKITAQQNNSRIQGSMNDQLLEKRNTTMAVHQQNYYQHKKEEVAKQISSYQKYLQNNPDQHIVNWSCRNIPSNHVIFQPYGIPQKIRNTLYYQSNPTFTGYIYHPYNIYSDHSYHSEQQNIWPSNSNISNPITSAYLCKRTKTSTEPSSLLKMKVYKEIICPQKRNNGLQDPDTIHNALEALQNPVLCGKSIIRLNGTQNPNEIPEDIQLQFPIKTNTQFSKKVLSNDLKNSKYFDNFPVHILRSKRQNESIMTKYPQQRQRDGTFFYAHSGKEKHHNNNTTSFQDVPQYYQMQQYYPNEQNEYNGSQGDIAGKQSNTPNATRIFHASGDNIEG